jgi:hypothetical protein
MGGYRREELISGMAAVTFTALLGKDSTTQGACDMPREPIRAAAYFGGRTACVISSFLVGVCENRRRDELFPTNHHSCAVGPLL